MKVILFNTANSFTHIGIPILKQLDNNMGLSIVSNRHNVNEKKKVLFTGTKQKCEKYIEEY